MTPDGGLVWNRPSWPGGYGGQRICRHSGRFLRIEGLEGKGEYLESTEVHGEWRRENHAYAQATAGNTFDVSIRFGIAPDRHFADRYALGRSTRTALKANAKIGSAAAGARTANPLPLQRHRGFSINPPSHRTTMPGSAMPGFHRPGTKGMSHHQPDC